MARRLQHTTTTLNPEAWVLEPASWGFVMDVWGGEPGVADFDPSEQSFPLSARDLPVDAVGFAVDRESAPAGSGTDWAQWNFDPERWGFHAGWSQRAGSES